MNGSIRSWFWLTYVAVALAALLFVTGVLALALRNSNLLARSAEVRLRVAEENVLTRQQTLESDFAVKKLLEEEAAARNVRFLLIDGEEIVFDSAPDQAPLPVSALMKDTEETAELARDRRLRMWLYVAKEMGEFRLITAAPRPAFTLWMFYRDDLGGSIIRAGIFATLLALVVAYWMARWVSRPLQKLAAASTRMTRGEDLPLLENGPNEIRELATALNAMSRQVKAGQQSQRDFLVNVSHELKTPLTSIQGFSQAILDGTVSDYAGARQAAGVIHHETQRMNRLVQELLTLARLDAGIAELRREPVSIPDLLDMLEKRMRPLAVEARVTLDVAWAELPSLRGDGDRLAQVLTNLVDNAIHFTPAGGTVRVRAEQQGDWAVIRVEDSGVGISIEDQTRIFERFFQADRSRMGGDHRGTGLGLAIARQIVEAHGGSITVQSQTGQGSLFMVKIPYGSVAP